MKFPKMFRMQMILAGLAAALFFAGTARAQEITNIEFNNAPNSVPFVQPPPMQPSNSNSSNAGLTGSQAMKAVGSISASASVQQARVTPSKSARMWVASTLVFCVGLLVSCARTTKNEGLNPRNSIRSMPLA
jgi:hypothetical protein